MRGADDPERALAIAYARPKDRAGFAALLALDDALGAILRTTREPLVGQMRLTWWHDALLRLDHAPAPAEPTLQALAADVVPRGIGGERLAGLVEGWEALLDPETPKDALLQQVGAYRGERLFTMAGALLGATHDDPVASAGRGWALADLARHTTDRDVAALAGDAARDLLDRATRIRWSRNARPLGALAHLARMDLAVPADRPIPHGAPRRIARLLRHRITGR